jgi:hypothetical protein
MICQFISGNRATVVITLLVKTTRKTIKNSVALLFCGGRKAERWGALSAGGRGGGGGVMVDEC